MGTYWSKGIQFQLCMMRKSDLVNATILYT